MINGTLRILGVAILSALVATTLSGESFGKTIESPKKQVESGIAPEDVICRDGLILAISPSNTPLCVTPATAAELEKRGYDLSYPEPRQAVKTESNEPVKQDTTSSAKQNTASSTIKGQTGKTDAKIENIPASSGSIVNFYITDDDLNTSPSGVDIIPTAGLLEFTINGVSIDGPSTMIETGPNTGKFYVRLEIPSTINGNPVTQNDVIQIRYIDQSNAAGEQSVSAKSIPLSQTYAQVQASGGGQSRIGREFTVRIYEPDANLDSREVDRIPLSKIEYRGEGGIRTTLSNPAFDANSSFLLETGTSTGVFEVKIKIPRTISGKTVHIGDWYEITYIDTSTPSNTSEKIVLKGRIG